MKLIKLLVSCKSYVFIFSISGLYFIKSVSIISFKKQFKCKMTLGLGILVTNISLISTILPPFGFLPRFLVLTLDTSINVFVDKSNTLLVDESLIFLLFVSIIILEESILVS